MFSIGSSGSFLTVKQRYAQYVSSDPEISPEEGMPPISLDAFVNLWEDRGVQMAMLKGNEYALHDNLALYVPPMHQISYY